jgi:hypothetical protein
LPYVRRDRRIIYHPSGDIGDGSSLFGGTTAVGTLNPQGRVYTRFCGFHVRDDSFRDRSVRLYSGGWGMQQRNEKVAEPSMEDILASIRKIISEDPAPAKAATPAASGLVAAAVSTCAGG